MTQSTDAPSTRKRFEALDEHRARCIAEIDALPTKQAQRLHELRAVVEASHEAARLAMLAYVRGAMETQSLSEEDKWQIEGLFFGRSNDPTADGMYALFAQRQTAYEIDFAHDEIFHPGCHGSVIRKGGDDGAAL